MLRSFIINVLLEGKVEDLQKKYVSKDLNERGKMSIRSFNEFIRSDPSPTKKYLDWMCKQWISIADPNARSYSLVTDMKSSINFFNDNIQRFPKKDINAYKSVKELEDECKRISRERSNSQQKKENKTKAKKLIDNDEMLLVRPDDKNAVVTYGAGTKWCITMRDASYYETYSNDGIIFYFQINKRVPTNDALHKIAYAINKQNPDYHPEAFDAEDERLDIESLKETEREVWSIIYSDIDAAPDSFRVRFERSNNAKKLYTDDELIDYWKENFLIKDLDGHQNISNDRFYVLNRLTIAEQKKIAKIDKDVFTALKQGQYYTIDNGLSKPLITQSVFMRLNDNELFYELIDFDESWQCESPKTGETVFIDKHLDSEGNNLKTPKHELGDVFIDDEENDYVKLDRNSQTVKNMLGMKTEKSSHGTRHTFNSIV